MLYVSVVVACLTGLVAGSTGWDRLDTTFGKYYGVPITESAIKNKGWTKMMDCSNSNMYGPPGTVYSDGGDLSSMPFFNQNGELSGVILGMDNPGASSEAAPFVEYTLANGTNFWGVEANFRDPSLLCQSGVSPSSDKVGDRLWIRYPNKNEYYEAPLTEDTSALSSDGWVKGACFVGMGMHYWRYITVDEDCNTVYPIFLLYNHGKLDAWGIALGHDDRPTLTSKRWEHPEGNEIKMFFASGGMPSCLPNQGVLSTQHIFMTNALWDNCL